MEVKNKMWAQIAIGAGIVVAICAIFAILFATVWRMDLKVLAVQVGEEQTVRVGWSSNKNVDKVVINITHNGEKVESKTITDKAILKNGYAEVYAYYGKQKVSVTAYSGAMSKASDTTCVDVYASEYNIAPITATMPVTIFTLSLDEVTRGGTIPTFVWFKRSGAWDWDNLPASVYKMPVATNAEFLKSNEVKMYDKTSAWVKELYELNPNSKFNFYYNDYFAYGWMDATYGNNLPKENYNVVLLSDGTESFNCFNRHFDNENAEANYAEMKAKYNQLTEQVRRIGSYEEENNVYSVNADDSKEYAYVMVKEEPNVEWWLTRINGTMATNNATMFAELSANEKVKVKDLNSLLKALDDTQKQKVKDLYKFSDTMFEKAEKEGKEIMVILGTWTVTEDANNFAEYVGATIANYGDKYVYYYKGHPKNPTQSVPGKLEKLNKMGLIDVDSTIPAELILFFNPDAFVSGYSSTTFVSTKADKCCALFKVPKNISSGDEMSYKDNMQVFMTKVTSDNATYGSIVTSDKCILLEYKDTTKYDIAIYDANKNTMKYYKVNGDNFTAVSK